MEEGDIVLCTVERIDNTVVFVRLENGSQGTIITSEIAPGRIKNIREYVAPNKKIVCKILKISGNNINLSLRRVTSKEKKEILERFSQEQTFNSAFKQIFKEKAEEIKQSIFKDYPHLSDFSLKARENDEILKKYIPDEFISQIKKIIEKKKKQIEIKQVISLKSHDSDGIKKIKSVLSANDKSLKINYISAGKFQLKINAENYKDGNKMLQEILQSIEKKAKQNNCEYNFEKLK